MVLKYRHPIFFALLLSSLTGVFGCEDNPDECYSNSDCPKGCQCKATYYYSGTRSGGYCEIPDGGEQCTPQTSTKGGTGGASGSTGGSAGTEPAGAGAGGQSQADDAST
jgi:hypothetical protein